MAGFNRANGDIGGDRRIDIVMFAAGAFRPPGW
jgi:hypothetical protein